MTTNTRARRINRGCGHSYLLDGKPVQGVTTILKTALPKPALIQWAAREVASCVASRRDILMDLNDEELVDFLRGAPGRTKDKAANRGTEVHALAARLARGEEVDVPEELDPLVDSYLGFLDHFEPANAVLERPVFNASMRYGGTFDMVADTAQLGRCLFDLKTSRSGVYGEVALQLCAYGHGEFYVDEESREVPMPEIDSYAAVWIRADGFDVYPIEVTDREWRTFQYLQQVAWWIENRQNVVKGDSLWQRQVVPA